MAKRHSMRDGPLAQLFKATETVSEIAAKAERTAAERTGRASLVDADEIASTLPAAAPRVPYLAVIRVVGVGGGGCNAINRMIEAGVGGVEFIALNTDIQQLQMCEAPTKIQIGREDTKGLGSGADPEVGRQAAEEAHDR